MCLAFPTRLQAGALFLLLIPLAAGCGGGNGGTDVGPPSLSIKTSTTGVELDPDGYTVQVDGLAAQTIGIEGTLTVDRLADGPHTVALSGLAPNCAAQGENPQTANVSATATASVTFSVVCGPSNVALEVVTATTGAPLDPDGFVVMIDGISRGAIAPSASATYAGLTVGTHTVDLTGVAANCQAVSDHPLGVAVQPGETARVSFAITCAATTGDLEVVTATTGTALDPDGFVVLIDGISRGPIAASATATYAGLTASLHTVELTGVAANCQAVGDHPLGVAVQPGETARVSFAITCATTTGGLTLTISGLPAGVAAAVSVTGPNNFSRALTATQALTGLPAGSYTVSAQNVVSGGTTYTPSIGRPTVDVVAGGTATTTVSYTAVASVTLNLRIDGLYLTQSTQTYSSAVPLVAGRDAYLRVFVVANESNSAKPRVRVRLSRPGAAARTINIEAPGASTPTQVQEGVLGSSWNQRIAGSDIQSGLTIVADVDPNTAIAESNETDNQFPATGNKAFTVRSARPAKIRFVSVQQGTSAPGDVSAPNQLMDLARRIHPLSVVDVDVHSTVFTASVPLQANGAGWDQVLSDLDALRVSDASDRTYFGIAKLTYGRQDGLVGLAFQGVPTALGWDDAGDASRVVAHELGHTWNRRHTVCGGPPPATVDQLYPYSGGQIGVNGMDVANTELKPASSPDIMGYCFQNPWISDYTYQGVMAFRQANAGSATAPPQPSVLIWGRIENGRPVLEPAFQIVTRPSLPSRPGPYAITGSAADGSRLFALSFDAATADDNPRNSGHFAFAVPLDQARAIQLTQVRLSGPGGTVANSRAAASLRMGTALAPVARREGQSVVIQWNASVYPTIMVRDPDSGEVLSFARGGSARVWTSKNQLDLELSDGVRSQRLRLAINRS